MNIATLVDRLVQRLDLDRIFLFSCPFLEEEQQRLLLVVNPVKGLSPKAMAPIVSLCMSDLFKIPFDMVTTGEWQNQLKRGNLYYTYASLPPHQLYAASKKKSPLLSRKVITGLLELSELNYRKCRKSSDEFRGGVDNFLATEDFSQASFMLHQFMELRLKGFQTVLGITAGKSHNIEHLVKSTGSMVPPLMEIFPYDSPSGYLFRLLDQAYVKAKKQDGIGISRSEFKILLENCERARRVMDGMVASTIERITAYCGQLEEPQCTDPAVATPSLAMPVICEDFAGFPWPEQLKEDTNKLLDSIHKTHRPEQITMLTYHTGRVSGASPFVGERAEERKSTSVELYLVVLMKSKGPFHFRRLQVGEAHAMVIYLNIELVEKKLAEGDRFIHTVWTKGCVLRKKSAFEPAFDIREVDWNAEHERVSYIWNNAKVCLSNLNGVIQNTAALKHDLGLLLLRNSVEIGVHTYLQCAVGYVPKQLGLAELIDWSGIAGRTLLDFLYPAGHATTARKYLVLNPENIWWRRASTDLSSLPPTFCREKSGELFTVFECLCTDVLKELVGKAEK